MSCSKTCLDDVITQAPVGHYSDVIMCAMASQITPASRLFAQPFI